MKVFHFAGHKKPTFVSKSRFFPFQGEVVFLFLTLEGPNQRQGIQSNYEVLI